MKLSWKTTAIAVTLGVVVIAASSVMTRSKTTTGNVDVVVDSPTLGVDSEGNTQTAIKTSEQGVSSKRTIKGVVKDSEVTRIVPILTQIDDLSMTQAILDLEKLDQSEGEIYVLLSSPGGSIFAGDRFIASMQSAKNKVNTICMDFCASMAAIIHQHGAKRYAYDKATLMFHDASGGFRGEFGKMRQLFNYIQKRLDKTNSYIASRSKLSYSDFMSLVSKDYWIDSEDAERVGLVDAVIRVIPISELLPQTEGELKKRRNNQTNGNQSVTPFTVLPLTFGIDTDGTITINN